jgi:hypothetical protein
MLKILRKILLIFLPREIIMEQIMARKKESKSKQSCGLPMTAKDVSNRLAAFNQWRSGEDGRTMDEAGLKPRQITLDLEFAIKELAKL